MIKLFISFLFILFISCSNTRPTADLGPEDFNSPTDAKEYYSQKIKGINSVAKNELYDIKKSVLKEIKSEELIYLGPTGLPSDLGEREILLINAMESALQEGHSREYQNMMKQYFKNLQQGENTSDE